MTPRVGDLVYFQWPGVGRICHVGIVEAIRSDGRIVSIEGNAQPDVAGDQSNGGGVYRRVRSLASVKGFGHPVFESQSTNVAEVKSNPAPANSAGIAVDGDWGPATTSALQRVLGGLAVDGQFGPATKRRLQQVLGGLAVDGAFGPKSIAALQRRVGAPADGQLGPVTIRALQARLNTADCELRSSSPSTMSSRSSRAVHARLHPPRPQVRRRPARHPRAARPRWPAAGPVEPMGRVRGGRRHRGRCLRRTQQLARDVTARDVIPDVSTRTPPGS